MTISFKCPGCGVPMQVPDEYAGKRAHCNSCQAPLQVPLSSGGITLEETSAITPIDRSSAMSPSGGMMQSVTPVDARPIALPQAMPSMPAGPSVTGQTINIVVGAQSERPPIVMAPMPMGMPMVLPGVQPGPQDAVGNGGVVAWCIVLLATIVIPWGLAPAADGRGFMPVWSWNMFKMWSNAMSTFVLAEWIIAGVLLLLACILGGFAFSVLTAGLSTVCVVLLAVAWNDAAGARDALRSLWQGGAAGSGLQIAALLALLALYVTACLRVRVRVSYLVSALEGVSAGACAVLTFLVVQPAVKAFIDLVKLTSLATALSGEGAVAGAILLAQGFILLASVLAISHALGVQWRMTGPTRAALALLRLAVVIVLTVMLIFVGITSKSAQSSLSFGISMILFLTMPMLLLSGIVRTLGDILVKAKKVMES